MHYIRLHPEGKTMGEVVEFLDSDEVGAIEIDEKLHKKFTLAIAEEKELEETLRTGLPKRSRKGG